MLGVWDLLAVNAAVAEMKNLAKPVETKEQIASVGTISAGDAEVCLLYTSRCV